jgi:hypothetical protein
MMILRSTTIDVPGSESTDAQSLLKQLSRMFELERVGHGR